jgi:hypothetical protein
VAGHSSRMISFRERLWLQAQWRPDVEQHPVPGQARVNEQVGLVQANAPQSLHQHAFKMGKLDNLARFVPQGCQIPHPAHNVTFVKTL